MQERELNCRLRRSQEELNQHVQEMVRESERMDAEFKHMVQRIALRMLGLLILLASMLAFFTFTH